jgi:hypothetical protein
MRNFSPGQGIRIPKPDWIVTLDLILDKYGMKVWTGLKWFRE